MTISDLRNAAADSGAPGAPKASAAVVRGLPLGLAGCLALGLLAGFLSRGCGSGPAAGTAQDVLLDPPRLGVDAGHPDVGAAAAACRSRGAAVRRCLPGDLLVGGDVVDGGTVLRQQGRGLHGGRNQGVGAGPMTDSGARRRVSATGVGAPFSFMTVTTASPMPAEVRVSSRS